MTPVRIRRRPAILLAVAAVAAAVAATVFVAEGTSGAELPGDHVKVSDYRTETHIPLPMNTTGTFGVLILRNTGSQTVTISSIELMSDGDTSGLEIVDTRLWAIPRGGASLIATASTYAPPAQSVPAQGSKVPPTPDGPGGHQVIFGFRGDKPGTYKFTAVRIHYRIGGTRYVVTSPDAVWFCIGVDKCL